MIAKRTTALEAVGKDAKPKLVRWLKWPNRLGHW